MKKRLILLVLTAIVALSMLAGCAGNPPPTASPTPTTGQATPTAEPSETPEAPSTVVFTDSVGREIEVPAEITRVSPSGSLAQMFLIAIAPDLLVSTSAEYTAEELVYLPENMGTLPVIGQFYGTDNLNFESIAAVGPEIVIDVGDPKKTIAEDMDGIMTNLDIPAVHITATLESSPEAFRQLGKLLGREERGEELAKYCEKLLKQTEEIMDKVGADKKPVLYCLGETGQSVLAATSFHAEVLDYITENLAVVDEPSSRGSGNETDLEQIVLWNPEVILFAPDSVYGTVGSDSVWQQVDAIKNKEYYEVPYGPYNWMGMPPSINRYLGMLWLTKVLYPEYAEYDLYEAVEEYYDLFYHHELTNAEYDVLTANSVAPAN